MLAGKKAVSRDEDKLGKELQSIKQRLKTSQQNIRLLEDEFRQNILIKKYQTSPLLLFPAKSLNAEQSSDGEPGLQQTVETNLSVQEELIKKGRRLIQAQQVYGEEFERRKALEVEESLRGIEAKRNAVRERACMKQSILKVYPQMSQFFFAPNGGGHVHLGQVGKALVAYSRLGRIEVWQPTSAEYGRPKTAMLPKNGADGESRASISQTMELALKTPLPDSLDNITSGGEAKEANSKSNLIASTPDIGKTSDAMNGITDEQSETINKGKALLEQFKSGVPPTRIGVELADPYTKKVKLEGFVSKLFDEEAGVLTAVKELFVAKVELFYLPSAENMSKYPQPPVLPSNSSQLDAYTATVRIQWPLNKEKFGIEVTGRGEPNNAFGRRGIRLFSQGRGNDMERIVLHAYDVLSKAFSFNPDDLVNANAQRLPFPKTIRIEVIGTVRTPAPIAMRPVKMATLRQVHFCAGTDRGKLVRWCTCNLDALEKVATASFSASSGGGRGNLTVGFESREESSLHGLRGLDTPMQPPEGAGDSEPLVENEMDLHKLLAEEVAFFQSMLQPLASRRPVNAELGRGEEDELGDSTEGGATLLYVLETTLVSLLPVFTIEYLAEKNAIVALVAQDQTFDQSDKAKAQLLQNLAKVSKKKGATTVSRDFSNLYKTFQPEAYQLISIDATFLGRVLWRLPGALFHDVVAKKSVSKYPISASVDRGVFWAGPELLPASPRVSKKALHSGNATTSNGGSGEQEEAAMQLKNFPPLTHVVSVGGAEGHMVLAHRSGALLVLSQLCETNKATHELYQSLTVAPLTFPKFWSPLQSFASLCVSSYLRVSSLDKNVTCSTSSALANTVDYETEAERGKESRLTHCVSWSRHSGELGSAVLEKSDKGTWHLVEQQFHNGRDLESELNFGVDKSLPSTVAALQSGRPANSDSSSPVTLGGKVQFKSQSNFSLQHVSIPSSDGSLPVSEPLLCGVSLDGQFFVGKPSAAEPYLSLKIHCCLGSREVSGEPELRDTSKILAAIEYVNQSDNKVVQICSIEKSSRALDREAETEGVSFEAEPKGSLPPLDKVGVSCALLLNGGKKWCIISLDKLARFHLKGHQL